MALPIAAVGARALEAEHGAQAHALVTVGQEALARGDRAAGVLALERARWIAPRASGVRAALTAAATTDPEAPLTRACRWLSSREWFAVAILCAWVSGIGVAWMLIHGNRRHARRVVLAAGGGFVIGISGVMVSDQSSPAIVTSAVAHVLVAPYAAAQVDGDLPAGSMVVVGATHDDFVRVDDGHGVSGWLPHGELERVACSGG